MVLSYVTTAKLRRLATRSLGKSADALARHEFKRLAGTRVPIEGEKGLKPPLRLQFLAVLEVIVAAQLEALEKNEATAPTHTRALDQLRETLIHQGFTGLIS